MGVVRGLTWREMMPALAQRTAGLSGLSSTKATSRHGILRSCLKLRAFR